MAFRLGMLSQYKKDGAVVGRRVLRRLMIPDVLAATKSLNFNRNLDSTRPDERTHCTVVRASAAWVCVDCRVLAVPSLYQRYYHGAICNFRPAWVFSFSPLFHPLLWPRTSCTQKHVKFPVKVPRSENYSGDTICPRLLIGY